MRWVRIKPTSPKIPLGPHAASQGGTRPPVPRAKDTCASTKYVKQIMMLLATPTATFLLPDAAPNGNAIRTTTRHVHGPAQRPCSLVFSIADLLWSPGCSF